MEQLFALLAGLFEDEQTVSLAFSALLGASMFAIGLALMLLVGALMDPLRVRLRAMSAGEPQARAAHDRLAKMVKPVEGYLLPSKASERSAVQEKLIQAGYRTPAALSVFYATKTLLALGLPAVTLGLMSWLSVASSGQVITFGLLASGVGLAAPNFYVNRVWQRRQRRLRNSLPDALDLLVVCTEAGLGLKAALQRVADELSVGHPDLATELAIVNAELRVGIERTEALRGLAYRTGLADIRGLVTLISQSMRFGTSIADALRVYADEFRDKRTQRAEEAAAKIGTKMVFPLVLCLFPAFFVVVIGPAVLGVLSALSNV